MRTFVRVFLAVVIALGVAAAGYYSYTSATLGQSCTVGYAGTAASVTALGPGANRWCETEVRGSGSAYGTPERPTDILVCRYPLEGTTFTVRDQGAFLIRGNAICDGFRRSYERFGTPAPTRR